MTKINTNQLLIIEICSTAVSWTRVYKNKRAYNAGKMLFESDNAPKNLNDRQLVRRTLKNMQEIALLAGVNYEGLIRDYTVWCIDQNDQWRIVKMFA